MREHPRARLTTFGAIVFGTLALAIVAIFVGSHTLQLIGFIVAVLMVLLLVADRIPQSLKIMPVRSAVRRAARMGDDLGPDYLETAWEEEERLYRERDEHPGGRGA